uniref:Uncharacterized protein n=1 Tax=Romanomermis culicivorax TaxID=13658 RepID=A0A915HUH1_ROMCU
MSEVPVRSKIFTLLDDSLDFVKAGVECIIEDEVTCRFFEEQLRVWNLLTRKSRGHQFQR